MGCEAGDNMNSLAVARVHPVDQQTRIKLKRYISPRERCACSLSGSLGGM